VMASPVAMNAMIGIGAVVTVTVADPVRAVGRVAIRVVIVPRVTAAGIVVASSAWNVRSVIQWLPCRPLLLSRLQPNALADPFCLR
jgi:hypothetical protein